MRIDARFLIVPALVAGLQAARAGDITGTITLNGTPPEEKVIEAMASNPDCSKLHADPVKTQFYVVGPNHELKDVVVLIKGITGKSTGASAPPLVLDQKGCEYLPYVEAVQTGQQIVVRNSDPVLHNVHATPTVAGNEEKNIPQVAGAPDITISFSKPESFLRFKCDVHPWMFSYVTVVDSPYFAVTGADGKFKIANVPAGKYTVQAIHRKANLAAPAEKDIEVKDGDNKLDFTIDLPK